MKIKQLQKNNSEEWEYKKLGELLSYEQPTDYIVTSDDYSDEHSIPVLTAGKTFILGFTNEDYGVYKNLPVIIFDDFTTAHKYVDFTFKVKSSAMKILKATKEVDIKFIYAWMESHPYTVGEHKRTYLSEYQYQDVYLPPLFEQNRIVSILETWNISIEKLKKKIELKQQIKHSLMYDLLNGKRRLSGFTSKWETVKLEDIARFRRGSFPQPYGLEKWYDDVNGVPFVQVYDVDNNFKLKRITKRRISVAAQQMSVYIPAGSIVLTIQGSIGRIAITDYDAYLDRTLLFFQTFKKPMNKVFFMYSVFLLFEIEKNKADGGTIKTITKETLNKFTINITSPEEQSAIAEILTIADNEIIELKRKLSILKEQKRYLLNNLITGNIRTSEILSAKITP
jgi:type I restriction enzyme S subunit